jgi:hypothetical protein
MKKHLLIVLFTIFCLSLYAEDKNDFKFTKSIPYKRGVFLKLIKSNEWGDIYDRIIWSKEGYNSKRIHPILFSIATDTSLSYEIRNNSILLIRKDITKKEIDKLIKLSEELKDEDGLRVINVSSLKKLTDKELFYVWNKMIEKSYDILYTLSFPITHDKELKNKLTIFLKNSKTLSQKQKNRIIEILISDGPKISDREILKEYKKSIQAEKKKKQATKKYLKELDKKMAELEKKLAELEKETKKRSEVKK